jgi:hypothetical protein
MRLHFVYSHGHGGGGGPFRLLILTTVIALAAGRVPVSRRARNKRC